MPKRDYYEVLGINRSADNTATKKAYRTLAMKYHPDKNPGDTQAVEKMKGINEAYAVLSDPQKRRLYDAYGHAGLEGYSQEDIFKGADFSSLFREFGLGGIFGFDDSLFGNFFGQTTTQRRGPRRGADLRNGLNVTLEQVAKGIEKRLELPREVTCPGCRGSGAEADGLDHCAACNGSGQMVKEQMAGFGVIRQITTCNACHGNGRIVKAPCKTCDGRGVTRETSQIQITIPPGADSGHRIRVPGEGERGEDLPGDLYIVLNVEEHPLFERHGDDVYLQQEIDFTTAALGGEIEVPSLNGNIAVDISEGTQTGAGLKVEGQGIPHLNGYGKGDEYVVVKVITPTDLSPREKELLKQFKELRPKAASPNHEQG